MTAAYLVTAGMLATYATSVFLRYRTEQRRTARQAAREEHG
ncbi:MAG: hypothetical protein ACXWLR_05700 [Myxococcales bacterium]